MDSLACSFRTARDSTLSCIVCDEPLPRHRPPADLRAPICTSPHCRQIASRRADLAPAAFARLVDIHRRQQRERRARAEETARQLAERRALEAQENRAIRDELAAGKMLPDVHPPPVALPRGFQKLSPLPENRREDYRAHLQSIVEMVISQPGTGDASPPAHADGLEAVPLAAQLCACCGGGCCPGGGQHAYLTPETLQRVLRTYPGRQPGELVEMYLARLAPVTIADSCVNQTATGCSLPRDMRSDSCNDFHCPALRSWRAATRGGEGPPAALVIQRGLDHWTQSRSAEENPVTGVYVVSATATRRLDWPTRPQD